MGSSIPSMIPTNRRSRERSANCRRSPRRFTTAPPAKTPTRWPTQPSARKQTRKTEHGPPPIHVHHKFIVIDGDTDQPTSYSGSPNFSTASENDNDENVLEITGNVRLAQVYVAEFMRLYNHYRARALWDKSADGKAGTAALVLKM